MSDATRPEDPVPDAPGTADSSEQPTGRFNGGMARAVRAGISGESLSTQGVLEAIGGWRGAVEALVPGVLFLIAYTLTRDPRLAAIAPALFVAVAITVRLLRRENITSAVSGALGAGVAVAATMLTGRGEDYYLPGFITNAVWSFGLLVSVLVGWPLLGIIYGAVTGDFTGWRRVKAVRRAATWLTVTWLALFLARLAVQLPLYFAVKNGADAGVTDALGVARLVMGLPLFALVVIFSWFVLSRLPKSSDDSGDDIVGNTGQNALPG